MGTGDAQIVTSQQDGVRQRALIDILDIDHRHDEVTRTRTSTTWAGEPRIDAGSRADIHHLRRREVLATDNHHVPNVIYKRDMLHARAMGSEATLAPVLFSGTCDQLVVVAQLPKMVPLRIDLIAMNAFDVTATMSPKIIAFPTAENTSNLSPMTRRQCSPPVHSIVVNGHQTVRVPTSVWPQAENPPVSRVATLASLASAVAAIGASNPSIGLLAWRRAGTMSA